MATQVVNTPLNSPFSVVIDGLASTGRPREWYYPIVRVVHTQLQLAVNPPKDCCAATANTLQGYAKAEPHRFADPSLYGDLSRINNHVVRYIVHHAEPATVPVGEIRIWHNPKSEGNEDRFLGQIDIGRPDLIPQSQIPALADMFVYLTGASGQTVLTSSYTNRS